MQLLCPKDRAQENAISFFVYGGLVRVVLVVEIDRTEAIDFKT
jgi:hypothetical protein